MRGWGIKALYLLCFFFGNSRDLPFENFILVLLRGSWYFYKMLLLIGSFERERVFWLQGVGAHMGLCLPPVKRRVHHIVLLSPYLSAMLLVLAVLEKLLLLSIFSFEFLFNFLVNSFSVLWILAAPYDLAVLLVFQAVLEIPERVRVDLFVWEYLY